MNSVNIPQTASVDASLLGLFKIYHQIIITVNRFHLIITITVFL